MKKILLGTAAIIALSAVSAQAADLPRRNQAPAPYYAAPVPLFTWTGFYLGVNAGYGFGHFNGAGKNYFNAADGGEIGVTAGYNYQVNNIVLGIEGDFDLASQSGKASPAAGIAGSGRVTSFGTLRGRLGYSIDRALLYVTGGYAGANIKGTVATTVPALFARESQYHNGYALGLGLEYAFTNNISAKAEYLYTNFSSTGYFAGTTSPVSAGASVNHLRAGVNYRF